MQRTSCLARLGALLAAVTTVAFAADELPPASATEAWSPKPPVISAPAGAPPSDAVVLFDGKSLDAWAPVREGSPGWAIEDGAMVVVPKKPANDVRTKQAFGDVQLHLEFRTSPEAKGSGQQRSNSGIFFMGLYEVQVLDSYQNETYVNGQVGSVYKQHIPMANPSRPPGEWQAFDIVFIAPRFDGAGKLVSPARATVFLNGVLLQHDVTLRGGTVHRGEPSYTAHAAKLPLSLQDHGDRIAFRNIWARELR